MKHAVFDLTAEDRIALATFLSSWYWFSAILAIALTSLDTVRSNQSDSGQSEGASAPTRIGAMVPAAFKDTGAEPISAIPTAIISAKRTTARSVQKPSRRQSGRIKAPSS